jgi:hypothetical protein
VNGVCTQLERELTWTQVCGAADAPPLSAAMACFASARPPRTQLNPSAGSRLLLSQSVLTAAMGYTNDRKLMRATLRDRHELAGPADSGTYSGALSHLQVPAVCDISTNSCLRLTVVLDEPAAD